MPTHQCRLASEYPKIERAAWEAGSYTLEELGTSITVVDKPYSEQGPRVAGRSRAMRGAVSVWTPAFFGMIDVVIVAVSADCVSLGNVRRVNELYGPNTVRRACSCASSVSVYSVSNEGGPSRKRKLRLFATLLGTVSGQMTTVPTYWVPRNLATLLFPSIVADLICHRRHGVV